MRGLVFFSGDLACNLTSSILLRAYSLLAYQSVHESIMASTSHTINHTGEADTASSHTGWGPDRSLCAWIPTQYPPAASFAGRSSPSLHSPYSATMPLSPQLGPGILMTPPSTQQDQSSISWTGSPHSSQASPSNNNGTGDFHWMNLMSGPEFDSPTCARTIIQPHTTDTTPCQHHVHTPERTSENRTSVNAEYVFSSMSSTLILCLADFT